MLAPTCGMIETDNTKKKEMDKDYKLLVPEDEASRSKVQCCCQPKKCLPILREDEEVFNKFKESVFGKFHELDQMQWYHPLVHALMSRKVTGKGINPLEGAGFLINEEMIQFTIKDFALITGLRCGELPKQIVGESYLKKKYFKDMNKVTIKELEAAVTQCLDTEDRFRLGLVLFAELVLFGRETKGLIDLKYLKLVENIDEWNKFPWGTASWDVTNDSIKRALDPAYLKKKETRKAKEKPKETTKGNGKAKEKNTTKGGGKESKAKEKQMEKDLGDGSRKPQYKFRGFAYAFQVWAYEVFPALRKINMVQLERKVGQPRLFHWVQIKSETFVTLYRQVFSSDAITVEPMRPTKEELNGCYWSWGNIEQFQEVEETEVARGLLDLQIPAGGDISEWQTLVTSMAMIMKKLVPENNMLKRRVSDLEREAGEQAVQLEDMEKRLDEMMAAIDDKTPKSGIVRIEKPNDDEPCQTLSSTKRPRITNGVVGE